MGATTTVSTNGAPTRSPAMLPPAKEISEKLAFIEELTTEVDAVQERVLAEILGRNAESEYLANCGLAGAGTDRATFRAKVPLVTYEDLKPYIMRVANGDRSPVLTGSAHPISEFLFTSGTSGGEPKLIPTVQDEFARRQPLQSLFIPVMSQFVPELGKGSRSLYFLFVRSEVKTPSGLPARSIQTSYYKSGYFKHADDTYHGCTSPTAAVLCEDMLQSMYAQMVCGLCQRRDVVLVGTVFATGLIRAIQFLQQHWEQLAEDIDAGELGPCVVTDPSVREAVAGILRRPDPELAQFIRAECGKGDWAGIIRRVWTNAKYIETIATGTMAQYVPTLNYYSGGLPIASTKYISSECSFGLNLKPMCDPSEVSYTIMPNMAYFEFLPVVDVDDATDATAASELVDLAGVEAGREYEVVVTTYGGLNRYRVGDVLRVTGFHNAAPQVQFVGRKKVLLSIDGDKTDEAELQQAVERASTLLRPHGVAVLDYTSHACTKDIPGHYIVYWELLDTQETGHESVDGDVLASCCLEMEEALNYIYRMFRVVDGSIGPLEIRVVRSGTFEKLADFSVSHGGASIGQYKVPRCVTTVPAIVQLLDSRVVSSHFSPALPHWAPSQRFESDGEKYSGDA